MLIQKHRNRCSHTHTNTGLYIANTQNHTYTTHKHIFIYIHTKYIFLCKQYTNTHTIIHIYTNTRLTHKLTVLHSSLSIPTSVPSEFPSQILSDSLCSCSVPLCLRFVTTQDLSPLVSVFSQVFLLLALPFVPSLAFLHDFNCSCNKPASAFALFC